jgi:hypothetical protein
MPSPQEAGDLYNRDQALRNLPPLHGGDPGFLPVPVLGCRS